MIAWHSSALDIYIYISNIADVVVFVVKMWGFGMYSVVRSWKGRDKDSSVKGSGMRRAKEAASTCHNSWILIWANQPTQKRGKLQQLERSSCAVGTWQTTTKPPKTSTTK